MANKWISLKYVHHSTKYRSNSMWRINIFICLTFLQWLKCYWFSLNDFNYLEQCHLVITHTVHLILEIIIARHCVQLKHCLWQYSFQTIIYEYNTNKQLKLKVNQMLLTAGSENTHEPFLLHDLPHAAWYVAGIKVFINLWCLWTFICLWFMFISTFILIFCCEGHRC